MKILIPVPTTPTVVAGLPSVLRSAHAAKAGVDAESILLYPSSEDFRRRWRKPLRRLPNARPVPPDGASPFKDLARPGEPVLVISPRGIPTAEGLRDFVARSGDGAASASWIWRGRVVATLHSRVDELMNPARGGLLADPPLRAGREVPAPDGAWQPLESAEDIRAAERGLWAALPQASDGYIARYDRSLSMALSRLLVRSPVTPNQITTFSLALGLFGSWLLARPAYAAQVGGAILLWACCILDGCDGEIARLKHLSSPAGGRYDVIADNVVHVAIFAAIALRVSRDRSGAAWLWPSSLMIAGVLASMLAVWRVILSKPEAQRGARARVLERIASRDFIYLVLVLAVLGRLEWFLWAAAAGANVFWVYVLLGS